MALSHQADGFVHTCDTKHSLIESCGWTLGVKCTESQNACALQQHSRAAERTQLRDQTCLKCTARLHAQSSNRGPLKANHNPAVKTTSYSQRNGQLNAANPTCKANLLPKQRSTI
jgi:hypothetical protein